MGIVLESLQIYRRNIDADEYVNNFRDVGYFEELCKQCPNYDNRWCCPPFDAMPELSTYRRVMLVVLKFNIKETSAPNCGRIEEDVLDLIRVQRVEYEKQLLEIEAVKGGLAALFNGRCPHCGDENCARTVGQHCRHPEKVRPSLEALGFNVGKTVHEIFGFELQWVKNNKAPAYLCMVGAVFY